MTIPSGPEVLRTVPPSQPPKPPSPNSHPPTPVHPEHDVSSNIYLGPPDNYDPHPSADTLPARRPRVLNASLQSQAPTPGPESAAPLPDQLEVSNSTPPAGTSEIKIPPTATTSEIEHDDRPAEVTQESDTITTSTVPKVTTTEGLGEVAEIAEVELIQRQSSESVITEGDANKLARPNIHHHIGQAALALVGTDVRPLSSHPNRLETAEEVAQHEGPLTRVVLVQHFEEYVSVIADTVRNSTIVALEGQPLYSSPDQVPMLEDILTHAVSSDARLSAEAREIINDLDDIVPGFNLALVEKLRNSDVTIKLTDLHNLGPLAEKFADIQTAEKNLDEVCENREVSVAELSSAVATYVSHVASIIKIRNHNFAKQLDALRAEYPDAHIDQVVGYGAHYELVEKLDPSHVHALITGSPIPGHTHMDEFGVLCMREPDSPRLSSLLNRTVLETLYSIASHAQDSQLVSPEQLHTLYPDTGAEDWHKSVRIRKFLIDNMSDEEVQNALTDYDRISTGTATVNKHEAAAARQNLFARILKAYLRRPWLVSFLFATSPTKTCFVSYQTLFSAYRTPIS